MAGAPDRDITGRVKPATKSGPSERLASSFPSFPSMKLNCRFQAH